MKPWKAAMLALFAVAGARAATISADDSYLWLEEVESDRALTWVRERNDISRKELEASPAFDALYQRLLQIYNSEARIPSVEQLGGWVYNFWRDAAQPRGIWRRTTREEYRKAAPAWETVLDLDRLAADENENWVWKGATCLYPRYERCLLKLSRGGADAHVVREFDIPRRRFVDDGFQLAEAKHDIVWRNADSVLVASDFGPGSLTESGYPRIVKQWTRGTPINAAQILYAGDAGDVGVDALVYNEPDRQREILRRAISFFSFEYVLRVGDHLARLDVPQDAELELFQDHLLLHLRSPWRITGHTYANGSLIAIPLVDFIEGQRGFEVLFAPTPQITLDSYSRTRNGLLLNLLDSVRGRVLALRYSDGRWQRIPIAVPELAEVQAEGIDPDHSDDYFLTVEDFLNPTRLLEGSIGRTDQELLKQLPAYFDTTGLVVEQRQARSRDGTAVPYFQVSRRKLDADGSHPTLLYGYGGFQISLTPGYQAATGAAWLEQGGVYVVANIRGGGEFGPAWHQAALREHRQRAFDDFIAVAEDLIARRITSPKHLGISGGSNGGLLVGAVMTQRPELFGAVVCRVPLLDMRRYHRLLAGASWMSEYGNPDLPADWAYLSKYSPYQNLHKDRDYPRVFLSTSTRDDRVHPGHARKFAARLLEQGHDTLYYENIEGGHGGAANLQQHAYMDALAYAFLLKQLR